MFSAVLIEEPHLAADYNQISAMLEDSKHNFFCSLSIHSLTQDLVIKIQSVNNHQIQIVKHGELKAVSLTAHIQISSSIC